MNESLRAAALKDVANYFTKIKQAQTIYTNQDTETLELKMKITVPISALIPPQFTVDWLIPFWEQGGTITEVETDSPQGPLTMELVQKKLSTES